MQVSGTRSKGSLGALALVVVLGALLLAASARAAGPDASTRVAPGVYMTDSSAVAGASASEEPSQGATPRIVGGHPIPITQASWQAAITLNPATFVGDGFDLQFCGGSLVAPRLVVSAAHCLFPDGVGQPPFAAADLAVITGRTTLSSNEGQWIPVTRAILFTDAQGNPLYNGQTTAWDVSVFELGQPSTSQPIKIAGPDESELWAPGRRTEVTGWGDTRFRGPKSDALLAAELSMFPDDSCRRVMGAGFDQQTSICSGNFLGERDSCQGDSGGPLVAPSDQGMRLVGNVQSGFECARPRNPAAYGRLGADPIMTALRNTGFTVAGTDVYGSGAQPPTDLTKNQAEDLALVFSEDRCFADRDCRKFNARKCKPKSGGFQCLVEKFVKDRRGKSTCSRKHLWSAVSGEIEREPVNKEKCKSGW